MVCVSECSKIHKYCTKWANCSKSVTCNHGYRSQLLWFSFQNWGRDRSRASSQPERAPWPRAWRREDQEPQVLGRHRNLHPLGLCAHRQRRRVGWVLLPLSRIPLRRRRKDQEGSSPPQSGGATLQLQGGKGKPHDCGIECLKIFSFSGISDGARFRGQNCSDLLEYKINNLTCIENYGEKR